MFQRALALAELWSGEMRAVTVSGREVLLVRIADTVAAFEDRCVHAGVRLSSGRLDGEVLTCSAHEWQFHACTGKGLNPRRTQLHTLPVQIAEECIWVDVDSQAVEKTRGA